MVEISVIMPVFNSEKYLRESIESILNQTFTKFELIIVNDGSTDNSVKIIDSYLSDKRVIFINRVENKKLVYTLNEGLKYARGKLIARMDADDISFPDRFEKQFQFLQKNPNIMVVGSSYISFNENNVQKLNFHPINPIEIAYRFISNTYFCHPSVMFRHELVEIFGNYENVEAEDFRFFSKIVAQHPCSNLDAPIIYYREHDSNRSLTHRKELLDSVYVTTMINVTLYFKSEKLRITYFEYRSHLNRSIKQIIFCIFLDAFVISKIIWKYKKPIYLFHGCILLCDIAFQNLSMGIKKIIRLWN
jgi:glycosyltransferase involved in cell wall biosynthesis